MKVFQMKNKPNEISFTNYNRVDEEIILQNALGLLQKNNNIIIGNKVTGPSEDIYNCSISQKPFTLIYDRNYGPSIVSDDQDVIKELVEYFNQ